MKNIFIITILFSIFLISCNKEDMHANHMQHGSGRWKISSIEYSTYDSVGTKISDTTVNDVGEFIFMQTKGTDHLYGYHTGIVFINQADGTKLGYTMQWVNDGKRFNVITDLTAPDFNKVYSVTDDKGNTIELVYATVGNSSTAGTNMGMKEDIILTYEPGFKN